MAKLLATSLIFAVCAVQSAFAGQALTKASEFYIKVDTANRPLPRWSGGGFLTMDGNHTGLPSIQALDVSGSVARAEQVVIPGSDRIDIKGFAQSKTGVIGVCGSALSADGKGAGFVEFFRPGQSAVAIRTYPFNPYQIVMASDGTIWVVGFEIVNGHEKPTDVNLNAGILRHFGQDGKILEAYIPRVTIPTSLPISNGLLAISSNDIVGWYAGSAVGSDKGYFELAAGKLNTYPAAQLESGEIVTNIGITNSSKVFLSTERPSTDSWRMFSLDRAALQWTEVERPVETSASSWGKIAGSDMDDLIVNTKDRFLFRKYQSGL